MQTRAFKTLENDSDFCYGHPLCPPDGTQLGDVSEYLSRVKKYTKFS